VNIDDIDWEEMWRDALNNDTRSCSNALSQQERYDYIASLFKKWMEFDDYPLKVLERIRIKPEWSVLDVGCGTGAIAIPVAQMVKSVTAMDFSVQMLQILRSDAEKNHITNLQTMQHSWEDISVGMDIQPHDVVIMSRSLGSMTNIRESLYKVNQAAIHQAYITAWGGGERKMNHGIMEALGQEYHDVPDYLYVFNILAQIGIRPHIEHITCSSRVAYPSIAEALHNYQYLLHLSSSQLGIAQDFLEGYLVKRDDGWFEIPDNKPVWSLIWWEKTDA